MSGGIWRGLSIINCLREIWPSLLNAIVNNLAFWCKQSRKHARVDNMDWFFSMTTPDHTLQTWRQWPFRKWTGRFLHIHPTLRICPHRITTSSALSPTICAEFPSTTTLRPKLTRGLLHGQTGGFLQAWDRKLPERWGAVVKNIEEYTIDWLFDYLREE
jgi:hypothetical protein